MAPADNLATNHHPRAKELTRPERNPARNFDHQASNKGRQSHLYWSHIKAFAKEVKKRWPERRIETLAYQGYTLPPDFALPDNIDVILCVLTPSHLYKEPEAEARVMELVEAWHQNLGGDRDRLRIWDYPCFPGFFTAAPMEKFFRLAARRYRIGIEGTDTPVVNPVVAWEGGELRYRGQIYKGLRLGVEPGPTGPKARLYPVELTDYVRSVDTPKGGSEGRRQVVEWLRCYAHPGGEYRVSVTGRTEDGGNSWAVLYYGRSGSGFFGDQFFGGTDVFGGAWSVATDTFVVPEDVTAFNRLDLFRRGGTVYYGGMSLMPDLPEEGIDVSDRIEGGLEDTPASVRANFTRFRTAAPEEAAGPGESGAIELPMPAGATEPPALGGGARYTWSPLIDGGLGWGSFPWQERGVLVFE